MTITNCVFDVATRLRPASCWAFDPSEPYARPAQPLHVQYRAPSCVRPGGVVRGDQRGDGAGAGVSQQPPTRISARGGPDANRRSSLWRLCRSAPRRLDELRAAILCCAVLAVILAGVSAAAASPSCRTLHEAREVYPTKYLSWRGDHCWGDLHGARHGEHHARRAAVPLPRARPDVPERDWIYSDRWWLS